MKTHKNRLTRFPGIIVATILLAACEKPPEPPPAPRPALVMTIVNADSTGGMGIVGEIRPRYESLQGFRVTGKIVERKVETGAAVKKGQLLARLDSADAALAVQSAVAGTTAAEAQFELARANLERQRQLYRQKFISAAALDTHEAQFRSARSQLDQMRAQASVTANQSRYTALTADRDGIVTDIHAEPGQVVEAGEVIAKISDPGQLEVHVPLPESRMSEIRTGSEASLRLWAKREKSYRAKVREISPSADAVTRSFLVKMSILDPDDDIRMGMTAGVRFLRENSGVLIPGEAVMQIEGRPTVWLVDKQTGRVMPQAVTIKSYREDGALIGSGLKTGDTIVTAGVQVLLTGQTVRPVETASR